MVKSALDRPDVPVELALFRNLPIRVGMPRLNGVRRLDESPRAASSLPLEMIFRGCRLRRRERGASLIVFTLMTAMVLIPMTGLAIDGAVVFWSKAKLSSAVDAAALAAGRSINVYETQVQNSGPVVTVAQQWFAANFPSGWLGTSVVGGAPTVTVQPTGSMTQQVSVTASAVVPLYFMRLLHFNSITISAVAQSSRRNLNLVLVLDRSGSMGPTTVAMPVRR